MEDHYDWRYHYDIATSESSSNYAFIQEKVHIPSIRKSLEVIKTDTMIPYVPDLKIKPELIRLQNDFKIM